MTCGACQGLGFWPFVDTANPKPDAEITVDDLLFAVCLCEAGLRWRRRENHGIKVDPLWVVWCAKEQVNPNRVCMIEDVMSPEQLQERGLTRPAQPTAVSREAALLAAGKGRR